MKTMTIPVPYLLGLNGVSKPCLLNENKLYKIDTRIVIISLPNFKTSKNENNLLEIKEL